jgi:hypothetical protein
MLYSIDCTGNQNKQQKHRSQLQQHQRKLQLTEREQEDGRMVNVPVALAQRTGQLNKAPATNADVDKRPLRDAAIVPSSPRNASIVAPRR